MKENDELCRITAQDILKEQPEPENEMTFLAWLLTHKGMGQTWTRMIDGFVCKLLRDSNNPFPTRKDIDDIAVKMWSSSYSKSHQRHLLMGFEYCCEWKGMKVKFRKPRAKKRNPRYLTEAQMKHLCKASRDFREYALLKILCTTGLRLNELRMLNISDVDLNLRRLTVRHAKRDKEREIPLSEDVCKLIATYISKYHNRPGLTEPLFISAKGNRWSAHAIQANIKRCAERAKLKEKVTPHVLRHSFATAMLGNGCDLFHISHMLGHSDISTTTIYLHVNDRAMRDTYNKGVPRL
ncbi:MAG TPA: tyrosine-type recombinase/integrase [Methanomassiliicoccales archaeon]|nr:tyrosine-type recombinase/integrase [Methanomassiliicoccales archaeon]